MDSLRYRSAKPGHQVDQVGALHPQGAQVGDHVAQLGGLIAHRLLQAPPGC